MVVIAMGPNQPTQLSLWSIEQGAGLMPSIGLAPSDMAALHNLSFIVQHVHSILQVHGMLVHCNAEVDNWCSNVLQ